MADIKYYQIAKYINLGIQSIVTLTVLALQRCMMVTRLVNYLACVNIDLSLL